MGKEARISKLIQIGSASREIQTVSGKATPKLGQSIGHRVELSRNEKKIANLNFRSKISMALLVVSDLIQIL